TGGLSGLNAAFLFAAADGSRDPVVTGVQTCALPVFKVSSSACTDEAGNSAAAIDSAAFKIDSTDPVISDLGPTSSPNPAGWYKNDVVNRFKATDGLSGLDRESVV